MPNHYRYRLPAIRVTGTVIHGKFTTNLIYLATPDVPQQLREWSYYRSMNANEIMILNNTGSDIDGIAMSNKWKFRFERTEVHEGSPTDSRGLILRKQCGYTWVDMGDGWKDITSAIHYLVGHENPPRDFKYDPDARFADND